MLQDSFKMKVDDYFLIFLTITFWGMNAVMVKIGINDIPPILMTALRLLIVTILLIPTYKKKASGQNLKLIAIGILIGAGHFGLLNLGLAKVDAGTSATIIQLGVPFSALFATFMLREKPSVHMIAGMFISFLGVAVLSGGPSMHHPLYVVALILSALSWAFGNIIIKSLIDVSPFQIILHIGIFATPLLFLISYFSETTEVIEIIKHSTWRGWAAVGYSAIISTIIANSIWYKLIGKFHINSIVFFSLLTPVASLIGGFIFLDETITFNKIIGITMVISGIAFVETKRKKLC